MTTPTTLTSKDVATALDIDAKALRVFLRSPAGDGLSSRDGKSYVFSKADLAKIKKAYPEFVAAKAANGEVAKEDDEAKSA